MNYWLIKSEPEVFSIDDLGRDKKTRWEGVRNFQARNHLRTMKLGDLALFYHSNATPSGVAGICSVSSIASPDPTQFDPKSEYFDATAKKDDPRWSLVEVRFEEKFARVIALGELKDDPALEGMLVTQRGQRLSVMPVDKKHFAHVRKLGQRQ